MSEYIPVDDVIALIDGFDSTYDYDQERHDMIEELKESVRHYASAVRRCKCITCQYVKNTALEAKT